MSASFRISGTAVCRRDPAVAAAAAITFLNSGGGNRLWAVIANGEKITRVPGFGPGRQREQTMLCTIATMPAKSAVGVAR